MLTLAVAQVVVLFSIDMNYSEIINSCLCLFFFFLTKTRCLDEKYLAVNLTWVIKGVTM